MLWRAGLGLVALGTLGLVAGAILFPESNLLGGWALVFAPIQWIGCAILLGAGLGWLVARWRHRASTTGHGSDRASRATEDE